MKQKSTDFRMKKRTTQFAVVMILIGTIGAYIWSHWFLAINIFVALNMLQFTFTNWCLVDKIFKND